MSQSPMAADAALYGESTAGEPTVVDTEPEVQDLLSVLQDADCRSILEATSEDALSANEVAEACDVPTSTTYRKLDILTEAGLLEERTRIRLSGKHASEFVRVVEGVTVLIGADGQTELEIDWRENAVAQSMLPTTRP